MIADAHCHAWQTWPYQPPVPDPDSRGTVEQLLFEMDRNNVDRALIVCAEIDHNPDNNAYVTAQVARFPRRLMHVVDVDSRWKTTYRQPGAAERLEAAVAQYQAVGFTHYLGDDDGSWLLGEAGTAFLETANDHHLVASIHCQPHQQTIIQQVAQRFPEMPILLHHMGHPQVNQAEHLEQVIQTAAYANVYIKISGFYYGTALEKWDYPLVDMQPTVQAIYNAYGAGRLCWGSDYPVVRQFMTYRQAMEKVRSHCRFIPSGDMDQIMGDTLVGVLDAARAKQE